MALSPGRAGVASRGHACSGACPCGKVRFMSAKAPACRRLRQQVTVQAATSGTAVVPSVTNDRSPKDDVEIRYLAKRSNDVTQHFETALGAFGGSSVDTRHASLLKSCVANNVPASCMLCRRG